MKLGYYLDFDVAPYLQYVPEIERRITDWKLDSLVCGLGPTAWLLQFVARKLTKDLRIWGCNDFFNIMPCDDLVVMDPPVNRLNPHCTSGRRILESRPKRLWMSEVCIYPHGRRGKNMAEWLPLLPESMRSVCYGVPWIVWEPSSLTMGTPLLTRPQGECDTIMISTTGMTTLAWREGCRRIGVIGTDLQQKQHHMWTHRKWIDRFFVQIADQAQAAGGLVANLSPITSLENFAKWTPCTSTSVPISGSSLPEPSACSSTAPASGPPVPSSSIG